MNEYPPNYILKLFIISVEQRPIHGAQLLEFLPAQDMLRKLRIYNKNGLRALIQYNTIVEATRAREEINSTEIFGDGVKLKAVYSKYQEINIRSPDEDNMIFPESIQPAAANQPAAASAADQPAAASAAEPPAQNTPGISELLESCELPLILVLGKKKARDICKRTLDIEFE